MKNIFVFGSLNTDLVIRAPYVPRAGETIRGDGFMINPGGKGANQAVACGKLGGNVFMGGCVGEDAFGQLLLRSLADSRVCADAVRVLPQISSGVAVITVVEGDNRIILDAGANACADKSDVDSLLSRAKKGDIFLTQLENNAEVIGYALAEAKRKEMLTILNPAPATDAIIPWFPYVDVIVPNETEYEHYTKMREISVGKNIFFDAGIRRIVVTLGKKGYCSLTPTEIVCEDCVKAPVVDTTAAGDTFCGAFAVRLAEGATVAEALRFANSAAGLTVTRRGAQGSIPTRSEVKAKFNL